MISNRLNDYDASLVPDKPYDYERKLCDDAEKEIKMKRKRMTAFIESDKSSLTKKMKV